MRILIIKVIFLLLMNVGTITFSVSAQSIQLQSFEILNLSNIKYDYLHNMARYAESRMANITARTLLIVYPVGEMLSPENPPNNNTDMRGATHRVVLNEQQINKIIIKTSNFLARTPCIDSNRKKKVLNEIDWWLKAGGASQVQLPLCKEIRMVMISINPERERNIAKLQEVFFHEIYHSFQQDLTMCEENGDNDIWVIEGAADYFALHTVAWAQGRPKRFVSDLLERVLFFAKELGTELDDPGVAEKGVGALRLMIERGLLDESTILDGSLFHNCARTKVFRNDDTKVQFIKKHWHEIEKKDGLFQFKISALNTKRTTKKVSLIKNNKFKPYTKYIDTNNLRIFALEEVSDLYIRDVALIYDSMFENTQLIDLIMQKRFLNTLKKKNVYQRIVKQTSAKDETPIPSQPLKGPYNKNAVDVIWQLPEEEKAGVANEIVEHLLHTITTLGFYYAFRNEWRWDIKNSPINLAMQEAIKKGYYDISDYREITNPEGFAKVTAQEFAYWMIIAEWNYFDLIIDDPNHPEFSIHTQSEMIKKLPLAHKLYMNTVAKVISPPNKVLLDKYLN